MPQAISALSTDVTYLPHIGLFFTVVWICKNNDYTKTVDVWMRRYITVTAGQTM